MRKQIKVTGCGNCPFKSFINNFQYIACKFPESPFWDSALVISSKIICSVDVHDPPTPDWCPLKKESITISMKQNNIK